ncbi:MAG: zinc carboxypeptidase [Chitinophagaceae bacterium]|nr:zinc carboxypeptidase [Chitinophagaceae bacterium]
MRRIALLGIICCAMLTVTAQDLSYYLPKNVSYDPAIPTPKSVIGHEVGEWHVTHDRLVNYMKAIDAASDRVTLQTMGNTYEGRPQVLLVITSPKNHKNIESIRKQHLLLTDPDKSGSVDISNMPIVVWIGHSIHGNESSGSNASLLSAYYLAAAQGPEVDKLLDNVVVLFDPSFNPDGLNRFASWANTNKSMTPVTDPNAREFNEMWPGGRFNHYWFDLNRDWLPAQHVESRNRLAAFHAWKPNILTDHHEQGSNASFFFQPGVPSRVNPNTPWRNQELTASLAKYHAKSLDSIGSLYFTKEGYDDFYYGKGSTYPDINGAIGILFEQASSRGHAQETENGILSFPFTIRNQFVTALSTLEGAVNLRTQFLSYQRDFYKDVMKEADAFPIKAYVIGDELDKTRTNAFVAMLLRHQVDIYKLKQDYTADGKTFKAGGAYVIPTNQKQFKVIKTAFEKTLEYKDSLFYDVTAWTLPLAFGLPYAELKTAAGLNGEKASLTNLDAKYSVGAPVSPYAFAFRWNDLNAPKVLYRLQANGIIAKVATQKFRIAANGREESFDYGTIIVPVGMQKVRGQELERIINEAAKDGGVDIYGISTGLASGGIDLGSASFVNVKTPKVMMFGGTGTTATDVGEIWHLLDVRYNIPVSIVDVDRFGAINPARYNVIIMPSGSYSTLNKPAQDKLREWVSGGGTLIATEDATKYLSTNAFTKVLFRPAEDKKDSTLQLPYYLRSDETRAKEMAGSLFEARLDLTHPLCYGYTQPTVSIFKSNILFMDQNNEPYDSPVMYTDSPLQSGYLYRGYKNLIRNTAAINIDNLGRGRVISMVDNLNFRAFWLGTTKLFMNSIYFGDTIRM